MEQSRKGPPRKVFVENDAVAAFDEPTVQCRPGQCRFAFGKDLAEVRGVDNAVAGGRPFIRRSTAMAVPLVGREYHGDLQSGKRRAALQKMPDNRAVLLGRDGKQVPNPRKGPQIMGCDLFEVARHAAAVGAATQHADGESGDHRARSKRLRVKGKRKVDSFAAKLRRGGEPCGLWP